MLKILALGLAIAFGAGTSAMAQPVQPPPAKPGAGLVLVKKDHGRKLGHYKHQRDDEDDDYRRWRRSPNTVYVPVPVPYYATPGYGSSYPPAYYAPPY